MKITEIIMNWRREEKLEETRTDIAVASLAGGCRSYKLANSISLPEYRNNKPWTQGISAEFSKRKTISGVYARQAIR